MKVQAITLMEAYIIENLRRHGVSNDELLHMDEHAISEWERLDDRFDYTLLKELKEQSADQYSSIINDGYTVKFLTLNGLINLLDLKLAKKKDVDFTVHDDGIRNLIVDAKEKEEIQKILSPNWKISEENNRISIRSKG